MRYLDDGGINPARLTVHLHWDGFLGDDPGGRALGEAGAVPSGLEEGLQKRRGVVKGSCRGGSGGVKERWEGAVVEVIIGGGGGMICGMRRLW